MRFLLLPVHRNRQFQREGWKQCNAHSVCVYAHVYSPRCTYFSYMRQRGVFVSQFIFSWCLAIPDVRWARQVSTLFLYPLAKCFIIADFGRLAGKVNSIRYEQSKLAKSLLLHWRSQSGIWPRERKWACCKRRIFPYMEYTSWPSPYEGGGYYNRAVAVIEEEVGNLIELPTGWVTFIN